LSWGGILAILMLGPFVDLLGATRVVTCLFVLATAFVIAIGLAGNSIPLLAVTIVGCGGCITAGQSFSNVIAAALYPTTARSTGVAWALGVGRAGTVLGPVVGTALLAADVPAQGIFFSAAVPALIAAAAMLVLARRLRAEKPVPVPAMVGP
jgi:AAHS family 4-hydroxybenzoate transporter-like MFS transporter